MTFPASAFFFATVFFLGCSSGNFLCWIIKRISYSKKHSITKSEPRFSWGCVFLSLGILVFSALLVLSNKTHFIDFKFLEYKFSSEDFVFFGSTYISAIIFSVFFRFLFIPVSLLYIFLTIHTETFLSKNFINENRLISFSIEENILKIENEKIQNKDFLQVEIYQLPSKLILPVKRNWYKIKSPDFPKTSENSSKKNFLAIKYENLLLKNKLEETVPIPKENVFPSLYTIRFKNEKVRFNREL